LKYGTIYWPRNLYTEFLKSFPERWSDREIPDFHLDNAQALDLWRIYGSKKMVSNSIHSYEFGRLEDNFLTMYSDDGKSDEDCLQLYKNSKLVLNKLDQVTIIEIPPDAIKYTVMFDYTDYGEWDFVYVKDSKHYYPVGDGLGIEVSE